MEAVTLVNQAVRNVFKASQHLLKLPSKKMWIDYDEEADVLYISFNRPQKSTESKMLENGVLLRYRNGDLVGITVLDASSRSKNFYFNYSPSNLKNDFKNAMKHSR